MATTIKLDFDGPIPRNLSLRWRMVEELMGAKLRLGIAGESRHKTRRGWHVVYRIEQEWPPLVVAAVQAVLGSDWARELYNVVRALQAEHAPAFWRGRANVLYRAKSKETRP